MSVGVAGRNLETPGLRCASFARWVVIRPLGAGGGARARLSGRRRTCLCARNSCLPTTTKTRATTTIRPSHRGGSARLLRCAIYAHLAHGAHSSYVRQKWWLFVFTRLNSFTVTSVVTRILFVIRFRSSRFFVFRSFSAARPVVAP